MAPKTSLDIAKLKDEIASLNQNWKRALADYQNLLRRVDHDKQQFTRLSNANLIARLLPSLDIIELAASHTPDTGVQMAAKQFHQALSQEGLEIISPSQADQFNPTEHECSETVENSDEKLQNTVAELVLKGYKIGDYILRPARVKVYRLTHAN